MLCHTQHGSDKKVSLVSCGCKGIFSYVKIAVTPWRSCQSLLSGGPVSGATLLLQVGELLCCFQSFLACQKTSEQQGPTQRRESGKVCVVRALTQARA